TLLSGLRGLGQSLCGFGGGGGIGLKRLLLRLRRFLCCLGGGLLRLTLTLFGLAGFGLALALFGLARFWLTLLRGIGLGRVGGIGLSLRLLGISSQGLIGL